MDKNKIKSFAIWARRNLIAQVSEKANRIGIFEDNIEEAISVQGGFKLKGKEEIYPLSKNDRDALVEQVNEKGFEQVMEEVAYTWFNRFMGIRYMEVNDYLPTGIRVLSSEVGGKVEPDVLTKISEIIEELNLNANEIYELLDTGDTLDREKAYRIILVKQCNELGKIIPQMFEKISDYTELLLPDNLLEEGSVIRKMVEDIEETDWKEEVEIIGWMYQYYISEKKDEVFAALKKNVKITKENIPAATQLFTPKWIVKYMVENSLGRLWLEGHPNPELQAEFKYYLEEAEQEPEVQVELQKIRDEHALLTPENIKVLDPCMGSGHILVYAFDVLYEIYKVAGYSEREIPKLILKNNIYGLDIDDRAAQLASFALIMKARHYNRRLFREIEREHLELNLCSIQESNAIGREEIDYFCTLSRGMDNNELRSAMEYLCEVFIDAKEYGSILEFEKVNFNALKERLKEMEDDDNLIFGDYRKILLEKLPAMVKQAEIMSGKYEVCITNPPYMGNSGMNKTLKSYVERKYASSKVDLFAVFIEKCIENTTKQGIASMVTMHSWMFLNSYENMRSKILSTTSLDSILHLGVEAFEGIEGKVVQTAAFIIRNEKIVKKNIKGIRLVDFYDSRKYEKENQFFNVNNHYCNVCQNELLIIPNKPIAYWLTKGIKEVFFNGESFDSIIGVKKGMDTGNNDKFLRIWSEIDYNSIGIGLKSGNETIELKKKWIPYNKGGEYRKWYGNNLYMVNWENDGFELKGSTANIRSKHLYFKNSITWSALTTISTTFRFSDYGAIFDSAGSSMFPSKEMIYYYLGLTNSKITESLLDIINPTLNYGAGTIGKIPYLYNENRIDEIENLVKNNILISKNDWNCVEISWGFKVHPLLMGVDKVKQSNLEVVFNIWEIQCEEKFKQLKYNEEKLNEIFIDIYGLQEELIPEIENKHVTVRKADRERDIKSFISYVVGCILGRYSIDTEGLVYAGGDFGDKWNIVERKVRKIKKDEDGKCLSDSWMDSRFMPDVENIIPITEDEYFEDDIVSRFIEFVRTVYGNDTLEENLDFISDSIGRKSSETSRQAIRRYFLKDFYKDHLKIYQKRPIYWMFESGKNNGFKCLVYMHRYNEQLVAKVRTEYLHTLQRKYEAEIERLQLVHDSEEYSAKDRAGAKKKIDKISKQIEECKEYDQVVAYLANEQKKIKLDDGVKVNYAKFQNISVINSKGKEVKMNLLSKI